MNERDMLLSEAVDCLTAAIEMGDDKRLRIAREWILDVAMAEPSWWRRWLRRVA